MKLSRRSFVTAAGAAVAAPALIGKAAAQAQFTFKLHHFLPPVSNGHAKLLAPWAKKIEEASKGRIAIQIFPSMQLGGTPPQLYDQARDGVVDMVWTLPGNTPGRFPLSEVLELPFIAGRLASTNAMAAQEFATKHMGEETKDVKLLCYWTHDTGLIHSKKQVTTLDSLKGQKLRFPTRLAGEALKVAGANAIGMPIPQVPESLAQGVIDGAVVPWEVVPAIKVHELVKYHTNVPGKRALYVASFFLAMNKAKFEALPDDLKKVIDDNSQLELAKMAGSVWDSAGADVRGMVEKRAGNVINTMAEADAARWAEMCKPIWSAFADSLKAKGHDGAKLIAEAEALVAKYDKPA